MKGLPVLVAAFALTLPAADVAGSWKASVETPNGTFEQTFVFKVDGNALTGRVLSQMGDADISNGKIDGDSLSFNVTRNFNGNDFTITYKGTVNGNEIKLTMKFPGRDQGIEMTAKKAS